MYNSQRSNVTEQQGKHFYSATSFKTSSGEAVKLGPAPCESTRVLGVSVHRRYIHVYGTVDNRMSHEEESAVYGVKDAVDFFDMVGQTGWHRDIQRTLIHWMGLRDGDVVLEAGCGAGHFILQLAQRVRWITGLDAVEPMLKRAQLNAEDHELDNAKFVLGDVRHLPFPDHQFDRVICINLLFMFRYPDGPLAEMLRVTKPGGEVILLNPSTSMNPWSAQSFCEANRLRDFERDSLLSWATAAARYGTVSEAGLAKRVTTMGGTVTESLKLMDGMALVSRIMKTAS